MRVTTVRFWLQCSPVVGNPALNYLDCRLEVLYSWIRNLRGTIDSAIASAIAVAIASAIASTIAVHHCLHRQVRMPISPLLPPLVF